MSNFMSQPKISIIIPTQHRTHLLPAIIDCFNKQTWWNKELLIFDDTPNGQSAIAQLQNKYPNVILLHIEETCSIGSKRNQLIQKASGELIAHFDDDDYYAPTYIETLAKALISSNADMIKLSGWFCLHQASNTLGYWDTGRRDLPHTIFTGDKRPASRPQKFTDHAYHSFLTGYGFSYLFKKKIWSDSEFNDINHGEDSQFHDDILAKNATIRYANDLQGICLHLIHSQNTSKCFPNFIIPNWLAPKNLSEVIQRAETQNASSKNEQNTIRSLSTTRAAKRREDQCQQNQFVSICTITSNGSKYLPLLLKCIENQTYPLDRIEWVIVDDSDSCRESLNITSDTNLCIKYKRLTEQINLGLKRNLSHELCRGEYIVYMDDRDYYYPDRVSHAVDTLMKSNEAIAGCTNLLIYFSHDDQFWLEGPYGKNHATANTFAMTKEFARQNFYENEVTCNEEQSFLNDYTIPMAQLEPLKTIICLSHNTNTFDKRHIRKNGRTHRKGPLTPQQSHPLKLRLDQAGYRKQSHNNEHPLQEPS